MDVQKSNMQYQEIQDTEATLNEPQNRNFKSDLYDRIHVSVKTMDRFIAFLIGAIIVSLICGIIF